MTLPAVAELRLDRVLGRMATAWAGRLLAARAERHVADGMPQLAVFAHEHVGRQIAMWGRYEREELDLLMQALRPRLAAGAAGRLAGTALDIGANVGNHALFFAEQFDEVLAFEPNPRTHALLAFNAQLRFNLRCFNVGLSDHAGQATLTVPATNVGMATLQSGVAGQAVRCELLRLDDLPELASRRVALVKIDVEGHEAAVLRGAQALLRRDRPVVVLEQAAQEIVDGSSPALQQLRAAGYERWWTIEAWPAAGSRWLTLARRALFGEGLRLVPCSRLASRFHSMIVALPPGFDEASSGAAAAR